MPIVGLNRWAPLANRLVSVRRRERGPRGDAFVKVRGGRLVHGFAVEVDEGLGGVVAQHPVLAGVERPVLAVAVGGLPPAQGVPFFCMDREFQGPLFGCNFCGLETGAIGR